MGTQAGSASSPDDFLDKLRSFAIAEGWTVHAWGDRTDGITGKHLTLSKGGVAGTFASDFDTFAQPMLVVMGHDAYNGALNPMLQANRSIGSPTNDVTGPFQAHNLFGGTGASGPYLHAVIETQPGLFRHLGLGMINKLGAVSTGVYAHGTWHELGVSWRNDPWAPYHRYPFDDYGYWIGGGAYGGAGTAIRADADAQTWRYASDSPSGNTARCGYRHQAAGNASYAMEIGNSEVNGITPLRPVIVDARRTGNFFSPLGYVPDVRFVHLRGIAIRQILTRGADQWMVFPVVRKNGPGGEQNSGDFGMAYRIVE